MAWLKWSVRSPLKNWDILPWQRRPQHDPFEDCPACRHGRLTEMALMDTLACDFCRHIFSIDISQPLVQPLTLRVEDSAQPMRWQWTGLQWQPMPRSEQVLIRWLWGLCAVITVLPTTLMGAAVYLFPATGRGAWFATTWLGITCLAHGLISAWLLAEHYQWPLYTRLKLAWARRNL